jgi:hypothetical protein
VFRGLRAGARPVKLKIPGGVGERLKPAVLKN